jgi:hypothetical protein
MLGLGSGIAGLIGGLGHPIAGGAIVVGAVAIMVAAYARVLEHHHDRPAPSRRSSRLESGSSRASANPAWRSPAPLLRSLSSRSGRNSTA